MLSAQEVSFQYPHQARNLSPTSLQLLPGEFTLITGPSGSGKSTLARCLSGLIPHLYHGNFKGEVWLDGFRTSDLPIWRLAEKVGMVFQNPAAQMLAPTVADEIIFGLENLGLDREDIHERSEQIMDQLGLNDLRTRAPLTLSGGEQQKLALAAILARDPEVLVLDEPLSMLDTNAAEDLIHHLVGIVGRGVAVSIFEHRQEYLENLDGLNKLTLNGIAKPEFPQDYRLPLRQSGNFQLDLENIVVNLGGRPILQNLDLSLPAGQLVAIVGRNGVGKTTLLRAISGLQAYTGVIRIRSTAGDDVPDFGIVFQNPDLQLFNPTVKDEINYRISNPDLVYYEAILTALGLKPYENTPPLLLSEGEKKRLALGLVMMRQPRHGILLDEPSLGQDRDHKRILNQVLRSLTEAGQLVVMTTHDITLASQADRLIMLGPSGVIAEGETRAVLNDPVLWEQAGIRLPEWFSRSLDREEPK